MPSTTVTGKHGGARNWKFNKADQQQIEATLWVLVKMQPLRTLAEYARAVTARGYAIDGEALHILICICICVCVCVCVGVCVRVCVCVCVCLCFWLYVFVRCVKFGLKVLLMTDSWVKRCFRRWGFSHKKAFYEHVAQHR